MNKNQVKGRVKKATGKAKVIAGKLLRNRTLTAKGLLEQAVGTVEVAYGDFKSAAGKRAATTRRTASKKATVLKKKARKVTKAR